jgi:predicted unusual protein kinase regulating ubiquinone biosynthesis (AarF/ABC1/UbiB family)
MNIPVEKLIEYIKVVAKKNNPMLIGEITDVKLNYMDFGKTSVIFKPSRGFLIFDDDAKENDLFISTLTVLMNNTVKDMKYNILSLQTRTHTRLMQSPPASVPVVLPKSGISSIRMKITRLSIEYRFLTIFEVSLLQQFTSKDNNKVCEACFLLANRFYGKEKMYDVFMSIPELNAFVNMNSTKRSRPPGSQTPKFMQFKSKMDALIADIVADLAGHSDAFLPSTAAAYCSIIGAYGAVEGNHAAVHAKTANMVLQYIMYMTYIDLSSKTRAASDTSLLLRTFVESAGPFALKVMQKYAEVPGIKPVYANAFKLSYEHNSKITTPEFQYIREKLVSDPESCIKAISSTPLSVASLGQVHYATIEALDSTSTEYDHAILKMIKPMTMFYLLFESSAAGLPISPAFLKDEEIEAACKSVAEASDAKKYLLYMVFGMFEEINFTNEYKNIKKGISIYTDHQRGLYTVEAYGVNKTVLPVLIMNIAAGESLNSVVARKDTVLCTKIVPVFKELIYLWVYNALLDAKGYMHTDLHGGNIFVSRDGYVTIIDFGNFIAVPRKLQCYLLNIFLLHNKARKSRHKAYYVDKILENLDKLCDTKIEGSMKPVLIAFYNSAKRDRVGSLFQTISKNMTSIGSCSIGEVSDFSKGIHLLEKSWHSFAGVSHRPLIDIFIRQLTKRNPRKLLRLMNVSKCNITEA